MKKNIVFITFMIGLGVVQASASEEADLKSNLYNNQNLSKRPYHQISPLKTHAEQNWQEAALRVKDPYQLQALKLHSLSKRAF